MLPCSFHFSSQSHFVGTKIDTHTHSLARTHAHIHILKSWSTLITVLWVCECAMCTLQKFVIGLVFYRQFVHISHIIQHAHACPCLCLWYPLGQMVNSFLCRKDDKEKHQKAIAIAHEMARQEFIFNQLILIHFYRWIFCILSDGVLSFRPSPKPKMKSRMRARVCMHGVQMPCVNID